MRLQALVPMLIVPALLTVGGCDKSAEKDKNAEAGAAEAGAAEAGAAEAGAGEAEAAAEEGGEKAADASKVPAAAKVWFVSPKEGAEIKGPVVDGMVKVPIEMGASGIEVKPAGEAVPGTGHHHIVIDGDYVEAGTAVPADDAHIHYGGGQTKAELELDPGEHTLTMQFADGLHVSYGEKLSNTIMITVVAEGE